MSSHVLTLRLSNNKNWCSEFTAHNPSELAAGIRAAWDVYIRDVGAPRLRLPLGDMSPAMAAAAARKRTREWLAERLARPNTTEQQLASWHAQVSSWTFDATRELGDSPTLYLHVRGPASGLFLAVPPFPRVARRVDAGLASRLWNQMAALADHDVNLLALAGSVSASIEALYVEARAKDVSARRAAFRLIAQEEGQ